METQKEIDRASYELTLGLSKLDQYYDKIKEWYNDDAHYRGLPIPYLIPYFHIHESYLKIVPIEYVKYITKPIQPANFHLIDYSHGIICEVYVCYNEVVDYKIGKLKWTNLEFKELELKKITLKYKL